MTQITPLALWIFTQITYVIAVATPRFRTMALNVMNRWAIAVFAIFEIAVAVTVWTILLVHDPPYFAITLYTASAACWVPLVLLHLKWWPQLAVDPVIPQQLVVTISLFGAVLVTHDIWYDIPLWLKIGTVMWNLLCAFDCFVWGPMYVNWISKNSDNLPNSK